MIDNKLYFTGILFELMIVMMGALNSFASSLLIYYCLRLMLSFVASKICSAIVESKETHGAIGSYRKKGAN